MKPTNEIEKIILDDIHGTINPYEVLQLCCYPMLQNSSEESVRVRLYIWFNGNLEHLVEQDWPKGELPDVGIGMHSLEVNTLGYGYKADIDALVEDGECEGIKRQDIIPTRVKLKIEVLL